MQSEVAHNNVVDVLDVILYWTTSLCMYMLVCVGVCLCMWVCVCACDVVLELKM